MHRIVFDTNVLIAALHSQLGASFRLLQMLGTDEFEFVISVPLVLEYEAVAKRMKKSLGLAIGDIDDIIDYICSVGLPKEIYYLWRPHLTDPKDDMVLELAVNAEAKFIITHNIKDFAGIHSFGIHALTPGQFLKLLKEKK